MRTYKRESDGPDAHVLGDPVWQPTGGNVNGAIELDGIDDVIVADSPLNPADGPFSVFAWIRGGAPSQVLISQVDGENWLLADPVDGCLMTEVQNDGLSNAALCSQTVITDGDWHRVGLTWDGAMRSLYVDDVLVAEDAQPSVAGCCGGLNLGCGTSMAPGTFFAGLVDDVRIYTRAVKP